MVPEWAISTQALSKSFPRDPRSRHAGLRGRSEQRRHETRALDDVTLRVAKGELVAVVGPNGSGKTTLLKVLSTLILPDAGQAVVNGHSLDSESDVKRSIGLVTGDERSFFWRLNARENLEFFAALYGLSPSWTRSRIRTLSELLGLEEHLPLRFGTLSSGIKQRVALARGMLHDPPILLLDEPTKSLDPAAARAFRDVVHRLVRAGGHTVLWVTQHLDEAQELGGRTATMEEGRLRIAEDVGLSGRGAGGEVLAETRGAREEGPVSSDQPARGAGRLWWLKALAFMKRDFLLMASYRFSLALQLLGILFSIATFFYIARIFGPSAAPLLAEYGGDYFAFVLIGMAFSGYLAAALSSFSSGIREGQLTGTLEAMLVTPARLPEILVCSGLWSFVVTSFRVIMYLILGAAVFGVSFTRLNLSAALSILILTILSFAALGVMSASFVVLFKKGDPFALAIGSASALLGGVYFPVGVLPAWLQRISVFLPITYSLRAIRLALLQGYGVSALIREIAALSMFAAVLCPTSAWLFRMAVRRSKRTGGLGQY